MFYPYMPLNDNTINDRNGRPNKIMSKLHNEGYPLSGGQTGEWALVQEEQMGPYSPREKIH